MHIVVIGGGATGLCAGRHVLSMFPESHLTVVERSTSVGGIWNCNDSPVYNNLHTNLPKELMEFPGVPFHPCERSFVHHTDMAKYLQDYSKKYQLEPFIQFGCEVTQVSPVDSEDRMTQWNVDIKHLETSRMETQVADLVMICSGVREALPRWPDSEERREYTGYQMHSSEYRSKDDARFIGKNVLLVGGGPSGMDIATEVSEVAEQVLISLGRGGIPIKANMGDNVVKVGGIKLMENNGILFDKEDTARNVDTVIWCTGYDKVIPFLTEASGISIIEEGHVVDPLYRHIINIKYPTMGVLHLNQGNVPFPHMDMQVQYFLNLHKMKALPEESVMRIWMEQDLLWRKDIGLAARHRHKLIGAGLLYYWGGYMDELAQEAGLEPLPPVLNQMFVYTILMVVQFGINETRRANFQRNGQAFSVSQTSWKVNMMYYALPILKWAGFLK